MASAGSSDGDVGLQIAPMVDVVFVLLLFFMASANLQQKEMELGINLPTRGSPQHPGTVEVPIYVDIDENGQVFWNQLPIDNLGPELPELRARLREVVSKFGEKQPVIITPSPMVRHDRISQVLSACTAAGVKSLSFGG
ncbi:biopolymer transporter ExbD [Kamptonema cortianum]|nr:biopolymer transporter ExbD [Oscillatoria laete-virens]MDK3159633.1 biopolymer transporter ExbD [Kamptonema cortianum]MDL5050282.1 biopolymer transporter ExbD [Oscillatoria amoena NRMC-F 0135]MDL5055116.1 biopolymer transporter ExbD [Oscillatoria laete-virens NRMC-F 0139]